MARRRQNDPEVSLEGFYSHFDVEDCLMFAARELGRLGWTATDLPEHQRAILRDLQEPLDEEALADMLAYWDWDLEALADRGRGAHRPAKPRVEVHLEITSKGNFKAEWFPKGGSRWGLDATGEGDFLQWRRFDHRHQAFDSRPSNELFFIRGVRDALSILRPSRWESPPRLLDHVLLTGCASVVERLKDRLDYHFEVKMLTDLYVTWEDRGDRRLGGDDRVVSWEIDNTDARQAAAEIEELASTLEDQGLTEQEVLHAWRSRLHEHRRSRSDPPAYTLPDRVAKDLKRAGKGATAGRVRRAMELMRKHRPAEVAHVEGRLRPVEDVVVAGNFREGKAPK